VKTDLKTKHKFITKIRTHPPTHTHTHTHTHTPTMSFLPCQIDGHLFDTRGFCGAPATAVWGWYQVARHIHDPNSIFDMYSVSLFAPLSLALPLSTKASVVIFFAIALQSPVHNAVQYFCIGLHCVLNRNSKRCLLKSAFPSRIPMKVDLTSWTWRSPVHENGVRHTEVLQWGRTSVIPKCYVIYTEVLCTKTIMSLCRHPRTEPHSHGPDFDKYLDKFYLLLKTQNHTSKF